jgi:hypothetical protein
MWRAAVGGFGQVSAATPNDPNKKSNGFGRMVGRVLKYFLFELMRWKREGRIWNCPP